MQQKTDRDRKTDYYIGFHIAGLLIFLALSGGWVVYLGNSGKFRGNSGEIPGNSGDRVLNSNQKMHLIKPMNFMLDF